MKKNIITAILISISFLYADLFNQYNPYFNKNKYGFIVKETTGLKQKTINMYNYGEDTIANQIVLTFDKTGLLVSEKELKADKTFYKYKDGKLDAIGGDDSPTVIRYPEKNKMEMQYDVNGNKALDTFKYNSKGLLISDSYWSDYGHDYKYNQQGDIIAYSEYGDDGGMNYEIKLEYTKGLITKRKVTGIEKWDGGEERRTYSLLYEYNDKKELISSTLQRPDVKDDKTKYSYEYVYWKK